MSLIVFILALGIQLEATEVSLSDEVVKTKPPLSSSNIQLKSLEKEIKNLKAKAQSIEDLLELNEKRFREFKVKANDSSLSPKIREKYAKLASRSSIMVDTIDEQLSSLEEKISKLQFRLTKSIAPAIARD